MNCSFDPTGLCDIAINQIFIPLWTEIFAPLLKALDDAFGKVSWQIKLPLLGIILVGIILRFSRKN